MGNSQHALVEVDKNIGGKLANHFVSHLLGAWCVVKKNGGTVNGQRLETRYIFHFDFFLTSYNMEEKR